VWRKPAARGCHAEQLNKLETEMKNKHFHPHLIKIF